MQSSVKSFTYDIASRITSAKTPDSAKTTYDYDKLNELVGKNYSSDSTQNSTFGYDSAGNRIQMTDASGKSKYSYDKMGRVTSVTNGDKKTVKYAYNNADLISSITYPDGSKADYGYDKDSNLITVTTKDGTTTYGYDATGRLTSVTRPNGTVTHFTYDLNSNIVALVNDDKRKKLLSGFAYTYDERNYIATEVATASNGDKTYRSFTYDGAGQLSEMTESAPDHNYDYTYRYDGRGNKIKEVRAGTGGTSISTYTYDSANRLLKEDNNKDGVTTYSYDSAGNLIAKKGATADFTYEYSVESRLKAVRTGGALLMALSYDGDGNRTFEVDRKVVPFGISQSGLSQQNVSTSTDAGSTDNTTSVDSGNHLTSTETSGTTGNSETTATATLATKNYTTKQYADPSKTVFWYGFGQGILQLGSSLNQALTVDLSTWFSDAWNSVTGQYQLIMRSDNADAYSAKDVAAMKAAGLSDDEIYDVTHPVILPSNQDSSQQSGGTNAAGSTDGATGQSTGTNNLPVTIPSFPGEDNRIDYELTYYVNDTNTQNVQVLSEYGATNTLTSNFTYGAAGRISMQTPGKSSSYYLPDGRGSVSDLTDSTGKVLTHYTYDPSGQVISGALPQTTDLGYNSEEYDSTTGLQYLRARFYDPQMSHFGVQDTVLGDISNPASLNLYNYAQSNPVNYSDPSGHNVAETRGDDVAPDPWVPTPVEVMENTIRNGTTAFGGTAQNRRDAGLDITGDEINQYLYGNTTAFGGYAQNRRDTIVANTLTAIQHVHSGNVTKNDLQALAIAIGERAHTVACSASAPKASVATTPFGAGGGGGAKTTIKGDTDILLGGVLDVLLGALGIADGVGLVVGGVVLLVAGAATSEAGLPILVALVGFAMAVVGIMSAAFSSTQLTEGIDEIKAYNTGRYSLKNPTNNPIYKGINAGLSALGVSLDSGPDSIMHAILKAMTNKKVVGNTSH